MITFDEFLKVDIRVGTIVDAKPFPQARKPAYQIWIDFGADIGSRKSSAQITKHYDPETLIGKQVAAVINFPAKQIGTFMSQCLILGFTDEQDDVILVAPDQKVPNGKRLIWEQINTVLLHFQ